MQLFQQSNYQRRRPTPARRHPGEASSVNVVPGAPAYIVPRTVSQRSENV